MFDVKFIDCRANDETIEGVVEGLRNLQSTTAIQHGVTTIACTGILKSKCMYHLVKKKDTLFILPLPIIIILV